MSTVGRRPKPSKLRILQGNPSGRPINQDEPKPTGVPTCPRHLNKQARTEWHRISKELIACGLLTSVDRAALACYCVAWSRWVEAEGKVSTTGFVIQSPAGYPIVNPFIGIANRAMDLMAKFATEFGLTPSSRSRLHVNPDTKHSDWDEMFSEDSNSSGEQSKEKVDSLQ